MQAVARVVEWTPRKAGAGQRTPTSWFTVSLVGAMMLVMLIEALVTDDRLRWIVDSFGLYASEADWGSPHFLMTLLTNQFVHSGARHFFFNTLLLLLVGATLEQRVGWRNTVGIWLFGGIFSCIAHIAFMPGADRALIGASGSISALLGAAFVVGAGIGIPVHLRRGGGTLFTVTLQMAVGAWLTLQVISFVQFLIVSPEPGAAYWVHLAGFAFGAFAAATLLTTSAWRLNDRPFEATETASAGD